MDYWFLTGPTSQSIGAKSVVYLLWVILLELTWLALMKYNEL